MSSAKGVQLITYVDRLGRGNISGLRELLNEQLKDVFDGVHLLPFFYPIDGEDAGFDPIDHTMVDNRLGNWADIGALGANMAIMADMIVNHMSAQSPQFQDVLAKGEASEFWPLFLTRDKVFAPDQLNQIPNIYRPRPTPCFSDITLKNGDTVPFWTTFTSNQIDIDVTSGQGQAYLEKILSAFAQNNVDLIRLDAAGYAIKKPGTNCFMIEETFDFIEQLSQEAHRRNMQCLVEIHSYYKTQIDIAKRCDMVYDFALPPLVLHSLFTQNPTALAKWLAIAPRNCVTVLDTHDGIGIVDVGPEGDKPGLLSAAEIDALVEQIHINSNGQSREATGAAASNVDLYQVNCTYYDALGANDQAYLIARAIQFFSPGIPQVYYGGLFAAQNDMALLNQTNVGRDINRPYLSDSDINHALQKPVVKALIALIRLRNTLEALEGKFMVSATGQLITLEWVGSGCRAALEIDFSTLSAVINYSQQDAQHSVDVSVAGLAG
ncbi:sucrose phosphorylase [Alteromonas gilva]|uniref:Sucrose phosphorylase n=1 Tax=Alteromonas gilva TaxID=2987522 RepID=A0ABT5L0V4_9ALTE|nr:sucrose phosphorylase [Alteromonas gilva]MDC8830671.1 sucrose phosphorylase [Alteromonas gilva]